MKSLGVLVTFLCTSRKWEQSRSPRPSGARVLYLQAMALQHGTAPRCKGADAYHPSWPYSKVTSSAKPAPTPHESSSFLGFVEALHTPRSEPISEGCLHTCLPINYGLLKTGNPLPLPVHPWDHA